MIVADPELTAAQAPEIARFLYRHPRHRVRADPASSVRTTGSSTSPAGSRRRSRRRWSPPPRSGLRGPRHASRPGADYPAGDVGANLVGFIGTDEPLAGLERTFDQQLSGTDGSARYEVGGGNRIPLGESTVTEPVDGTDLHDADLDCSGTRRRS